MTHGNDLMRQLQQARPPRLDEMDPRTDLEAIANQPLERTRVARRVIKWGLASAVPVAAAIVALVLLNTGQSVTAPPAQNQAGAHTAHQLLAAAAANAQTTRSSGRYFVTKTETGYVFPARGYDVLARRYTEYWHPLSKQDRPYGVGQHLGAAPFGPGSQEAWHADGSPTSWTLPGNGKNPDPHTVTAAPGPSGRDGAVMVQTDHGVQQWTRIFVLGGQQLSPEAMAALPTTATGLRAWLLERYRAAPDPLVNERSRLISDALEVIMQMPVTAQLRSAAYQILAELETATLTPSATDQRGRTGSAATFPVSWDDDVTAVRVIFDDNSGDVLSVEQLTADGKLRGYNLIISRGWTDDLPPA